MTAENVGRNPQAYGEESAVRRPPSAVCFTEACVDSVESARAAEAAGADRLELCGPGEGGLTPSPGLLADVLRTARVPVHVMVRPREGDFVYSADEFAEMRRDVQRAREAGAHGVVFGVLRADHTLDVDRMAELVALARLPVVCHRAFDRTPDADAALDTLIALGVGRALTSGHARTALEGRETLARHVRRAGDRIVILAGGSVRAGTAHEIVAATGVRELHARATDPAVFAELMRAVRAARSP